MIDRSDAVNLARNALDEHYPITPKGIETLALAVLKMDEALRILQSEADSEDADRWRTHIRLMRLCRHSEQVIAETVAVVDAERRTRSEEKDNG